MRLHLLRVAALAAAIGAPAVAAAEVHLTLANGRVTLSASNATVPQILAEWARVGHTRIVNGERVAGAPITLELANVPEAQALEIILRAAGGFVLAPRQAGTDEGSAFDRIYIVPTSNAPRPATIASAPPPPPPPAFAPPRFAPVPPQRDDADASDDAPRRALQPPTLQGVAAPPGATAAAPGTFTAYPGASPQPRGAAPGTTSGNPPVGVPVPGMVLPAPPASPGQAPTTGTPQR